MKSSLSAIQTMRGEVFRAASLAVLVLVGTLTVAAAETKTIKMLSGPNRFEPKSQPVKIGDTVEWVNEAGEHTATPDAGQPDPFKGSPDMKPSDKYSIVISGAPRTIKYHCEIHGPMMSGELVIGQ